MSKFGKDVGAVLDVWRDLFDTASRGDNLYTSCNKSTWPGLN